MEIKLIIVGVSILILLTAQVIINCSGMRKDLKQRWCGLTRGHQYYSVRIEGTDHYERHCSECGHDGTWCFEDGTQSRV